MPSHRFSQASRVRRRGEYQRVFNTGLRVQSRFFTLVMAVSSRPGLRLGIVASRKLGNAVRRNRAKRLIREVFRHAPPLPAPSGVDLVVIPRRELFDAAYSSLEIDFRAALDRGATRLTGRHGR
jgi:ribonuclease P protein component